MPKCFKTQLAVDGILVLLRRGRHLNTDNTFNVLVGSTQIYPNVSLLFNICREIIILGLENGENKNLLTEKESKLKKKMTI